MKQYGLERQYKFMPRERTCKYHKDKLVFFYTVLITYIYHLLYLLA